MHDFLQTHLTLPLWWPIALGAAILVALVLTLGYRILFRWFSTFAVRSQTHLDDLLLRRMRLPAKGLIVLLSGHTFLALVEVQSENTSKTIAVLELFLVAYLLIEASQTVVLDFWLRERKQVELPAIVRHLIQVVVYSVAILSIVGAVTGVNLAPIIATSTVITVVLGLALQDSLGNLFSGLALSLEKPFTDGDWIQIDGMEGQVTHVGWRSTHLKTLSFDLVAIPNSLIAKARVRNFSAPTRVTARMIEVPVSLTANADAVERVIRESLQGASGVLTDPTPMIRLTALTPLFAQWVIKIWIEDYALHETVQSTVMRTVFEALKLHGMAVETSVLGIDAEGRPVPVVSRSS